MDFARVLSRYHVAANRELNGNNTNFLFQGAIFPSFGEI